MSGTTLSTDGFIQLGKELQKLGGKEMKKGITRVNTAAMKSVLKVAKATAPRLTGRLAASLGISSSANRQRSAFTTRVGVRRNFNFKASSGTKTASGQGKSRDRAVGKGYSADNKSVQQYARPIMFGKDSTGRVTRREGPATFLDDALQFQEHSIIGFVARGYRQLIEKSI
ncbi:MAG: hypothetical protein HRU15_20250 [Planctomycetes bacterium]|nr:hypothetical protein [Planctomycetota bacterium]